MVHKRVVTLRKGIGGHTEAVGNAFVCTVGHQGWNRSLHDFIKGVIHHLRDPIHHIALRNQSGLLNVSQIRRTHTVVGQLIHLVSFEGIGTVCFRQQGAIRQFLGNSWVHGCVPLFEIVGQRIVIRQVQDELVFEFLHRHIGCVWTRNNFEAIVEQSLGLVVGQAQKFDTLEGLSPRCTCPNHPDRDVVVVARLQGKRTSTLQKQPVTRGVACPKLCPCIDRCSGRSPIVRIGVSREHEVGRDFQIGACPRIQAISSVRHALAIFPIAPHVIVIVSWLGRLSIHSGHPIEVNEAAHAKALIVHHTITVANPNPTVWNPQGVHGVGKVVRQWIVQPICILVRSFEEVHPKGGRVLPVSQ